VKATAGSDMMLTSPGRRTSTRARHISSKITSNGPVGLTGSQFLETQRKDNIVTLDNNDWSSSNAHPLEDVMKKKVTAGEGNQGKKRFSSFQRQLEYCEYLTRFPKLISTDIDKLKSGIKSALGFDDFWNNKVSDLSFMGYISGTPALNQFSITCGVSLK
jgi:hypothetical protein